MSDMARRQELAVFLRSRREAVSPLQVGLSAGSRRRTPGLRREELAQLSGVSVTWYTWLEQQRDITVSRQVVDALARSLLLTAAERRHLFTLAGQPLPPESSPRRPVVGAALRTLVTTLDPNPAYVMDQCWDLLTYNRAYDALVGGLDHLDEAERNGIWLLFTRPAMRALLADWSGEAQQLIGQFRAANGARIDHPRVRALIDGLQQASPDFTRMWAEHPIRGFAPARKHFHHPALGPLTLDYVKLAALEDPAQHLLTFVPADPDTAARLPDLLAHASPQPTNPA